MTFIEHAGNRLRGVHPDHVAHIKRLQPYHHPEWVEHPLRVLAALSNTDKHQILQVVHLDDPAGPIGEVEFIGDNGQTVLDCWVAPVSERHEGAVVGWAQFAPAGFHPNVQMVYAGRERMCFADGTPLIPRLIEMALVVSHIVFGPLRPLADGDAIACQWPSRGPRWWPTKVPPRVSG